MGITIQGIKGEKLGFKYMHQQGYKCLQPDLMCKDGRTGSWLIVECKNKNLWSTFKNGRLWCGTGLDKNQLYSRMMLYRDTGIRCKLLTFDSASDKRAFENGSRVVECYCAWLDELEAANDYVDTHGKGKGKYVRMYNIQLMNKSKLIYIPEKVVLQEIE